MSFRYPKLNSHLKKKISINGILLVDGVSQSNIPLLKSTEKLNNNISRLEATQNKCAPWFNRYILSRKI